MLIYELKDPVLRILVAKAKEIKARVEKESKVIEHFFKDIEMFHLIHSIPGFGMVSAAYLTSMVMDVDRFQNSNGFTAYFGVVPRIRESAEVSHSVRRHIAAMKRSAALSCRRRSSMRIPWTILWSRGCMIDLN